MFPHAAGSSGGGGGLPYLCLWSYQWSPRWGGGGGVCAPLRPARAFCGSMVPRHLLRPHPKVWLAHSTTRSKPRSAGVAAVVGRWWRCFGRSGVDVLGNRGAPLGGRAGVGSRWGNRRRRWRPRRPSACDRPPGHRRHWPRPRRRCVRPPPRPRSGCTAPTCVGVGGQCCRSGSVSSMRPRHRRLTTRAHALFLLPNRLQCRTAAPRHDSADNHGEMAALSLSLSAQRRRRRLSSTCGGVLRRVQRTTVAAAMVAAAAVAAPADMGAVEPGSALRAVLHLAAAGTTCGASVHASGGQSAAPTPRVPPRPLSLPVGMALSPQLPPPPVRAPHAVTRTTRASRFPRDGDRRSWQAATTPLTA